MGKYLGHLGACPGQVHAAPLHEVGGPPLHGGAVPLQQVGGGPAHRDGCRPNSTPHGPRLHQLGWRPDHRKQSLTTLIGVLETLIA